MLVKNKKAYYDYEILDTIEAGLALSGQETKSAKAGQINLKGAYIDVAKEQAWLRNAHISKYKPAGPLPDYNPLQPRKLLLHKKQISYLSGKSKEKGLTIMPLKVYNRGSLIKAEIAVARGKKKYDKKEKIKKREREREIRRMINK